MQQLTTTYNRGDVVFVWVTFSNQRGRKKRPAVILSDQPYHLSRADAIMMPLSRQAGPYYGDAPFVDWRSAGLNQATNIKAVIQTIDRSEIAQRMGSASPTDLANIEAIARQILCL